MPEERPEEWELAVNEWKAPREERQPAWDREWSYLNGVQNNMATGGRTLDPQQRRHFDRLGADGVALRSICHPTDGGIER